ncbi:MAG: FAD-dependent oxidoreductase, partial [Pandoraea sp.]|nr:FAD-dependent oxidoreductase [Pandoraea sp.]
DPEFVNKAAAGRAETINTCIGCNQACLDHTFSGKITSCLVNPRACHETELRIETAGRTRRVAVVGAGPAGLAAATVAARRGHDVTLIEADAEIGGQFNMAKRIPGKEEFFETLRYFRHELDAAGVNVQLHTRATVASLVDGGYDDIVLATGVVPRGPAIEGLDHPKVLSYIDVLRGGASVGKTVAVIGAGGIGFDVAEFLTQAGESATLVPAKFYAEWGIDPAYAHAGGLRSPVPQTSPRKVYLMQRKTSKVGDGLGKTTGWIHRTALKHRGVEMIPGVTYRRIDDEGLHVTIDDTPHVLPVDNVVLCTGQEPLRELAEGLRAAGARVHVIGGADVAAELDAKRAIQQGTEVAIDL